MFTLAGKALIDRGMSPRGSMVAYLLFGSALRRLRAPTVSTLTLAELLRAAILGVVVLREPLAVSSAVDLLAVTAGIAILSRRGWQARARGQVTHDDSCPAVLGD